MSAAGGTVTAGSARLPMITGCTNSTATWWAWNGQFGEAHHMVPPAENRRARASDARARSAATPPTSSLTAVTVNCFVSATDPVSHPEVGSEPEVPPESST